MKRIIIFLVCLFVSVGWALYVLRDASALTKEDVSINFNLNDPHEKILSCNPDYMESCDLSYLVDGKLDGNFFRIWTKKGSVQSRFTHSIEAAVTLDLPSPGDNGLNIASINLRTEITVVADDDKFYQYILYGWQGEQESIIDGLKGHTKFNGKEDLIINIDSNRLEYLIGEGKIENSPFTKLTLYIYAEGKETDHNKKNKNIEINLQIYEFRAVDERSPEIHYFYPEPDPDLPHRTTIIAEVQDFVNGLSEVSSYCQFDDLGSGKFDINVPAFTKGTTKKVVIKAVNENVSDKSIFRCGVWARDTAGKHKSRLMKGQIGEFMLIEEYQIFLPLTRH